MKLSSAPRAPLKGGGTDNREIIRSTPFPFPLTKTLQEVGNKMHGDAVHGR